MFCSVLIKVLGNLFIKHSAMELLQKFTHTRRACKVGDHEGKIHAAQGKDKLLLVLLAYYDDMMVQETRQNYILCLVPWPGRH